MKVDRNVIVIFQGSQLIEKARPEKGFFIKSKKRYLSPKDGREHSKFLWEPVTVGDLWVDETDRKCQMHFVVYRSSGSIEHARCTLSSIGVAAASNRLTSPSADRVTRCLAVTSWMPIAWT